MYNWQNIRKCIIYNWQNIVMEVRTPVVKVVDFKITCPSPVRGRQMTITVSVGLNKQTNKTNERTNNQTYKTKIQMAFIFH